MVPSSRSLSILVVSPVAEAGGAEVLLVDILAGLAATGVRLDLATLGVGPLKELATTRGLSVSEGPPVSFRRPISVLRAVRFLRRLVRRRQPDIVHASHPKGQVISRLACLGVRTAHTTQLYEPASGNRFDRATQRLGGERFAISEETAAASSDGPAGKPVVIRPGCDIERLVARAAAGDRSAAWAACGIDPGDGAHIIMVGRLQRFKGPFDFLSMAERVVTNRFDTRFLILGPDSPQEPGLRDELRAQISERRLDAVVGVPGRLSAEDLAATIAAATLLVHPAIYEPFGLVLVEALALATPVIAYDSPGPRLILAHGGGRIVPENTATALADAVGTALDRPELRRQWAQQGPGAAHRFDLSTTVDSYLRHFRRVAGVDEPE